MVSQFMRLSTHLDLAKQSAIATSVISHCALPNHPPPTHFLGSHKQDVPRLQRARYLEVSSETEGLKWQGKIHSERYYAAPPRHFITYHCLLLVSSSLLPVRPGLMIRQASPSHVLCFLV